VRRSSFKNAVNAADIGRFGCDLGGVQQYTLNGHKIIYLAREASPKKPGAGARRVQLRGCAAAQGVASVLAWSHLLRSTRACHAPCCHSSPPPAAPRRVPLRAPRGDARRRAAAGVVHR
jgi:hypothetical protein